MTWTTSPRATSGSWLVTPALGVRACVRRLICSPARITAAARPSAKPTIPAGDEFPRRRWPSSSFKRTSRRALRPVHLSTASLCLSHLYADAVPRRRAAAARGRKRTRSEVCLSVCPSSARKQYGFFTVTRIAFLHSSRLFDAVVPAFCIMFGLFVIKIFHCVNISYFPIIFGIISFIGNHLVTL